MRGLVLARGTLMSCSQQSLFLFCFYVSHHREGLLTEICCNKGNEHVKSFLYKIGVCLNLVTPECWKFFCFEKLLLNLTFLKLNDLVQEFILCISCGNTECEPLSHPSWVWLCVGKVPFKRLCELTQLYGNCLFQFAGHRNVADSRYIFCLAYTVIVEHWKVCKVIIVCPSFPQR